MASKLYLHHSRMISTALLAVMILSVLQLCFMPVADASPLRSNNSFELSAYSSIDVSMAGMENHDCCLGNTSISKMDAACPECEDIDSAHQITLRENGSPLFSLLYIVVQLVTNESKTIHSWRAQTEPDIITSRPEIYLANASFLE